MLSEFEFGMLVGGACAIVSFIVIFFFLNSRGVFDPLKDQKIKEDKKK